MENNNFRKPTVNHNTQKIIVSKSFMRAAADPSTGEFEMLTNIKAKCPTYKIVVAKPKNDPKKVRQPKPTYARMGKYIACLRDADTNLAIFEKVKAYAKTQDNPYLTVSRWFWESFPDYGCQPEFDKDGFPLVEANCVSLEAYKQQVEATQQQKESKTEQNESNSEQLGA